ncbi:hypothetical protein [Pseudoxanthomonas sp. PXM02]|uniref:hypothetical protein n=1 Tax=Pseudoxanthomonas sp. PXM02 TaxID=2769294 RepID=UPI001782E416|nr:hypothetical protein [Pseudoxanthomonas sp. PXM02]MBD9479858.1 hypothetical protein [Pseudoxanthomonas sp. PXM02]
MKRFAVFCLIPVLVAACATSPVALTDAKPVPADRVFAYGQPIEGPSGQLVVVRDQGAFGAPCPIALYVDGVIAAHFRTSEVLTVHLTPGQHVIGAGPSGSGMCSWSNEAAHRREIAHTVEAATQAKMRLSITQQGLYQITPTGF